LTGDGGGGYYSGGGYYGGGGSGITRILTMAIMQLAAVAVTPTRHCAATSCMPKAAMQHSMAVCTFLGTYSVLTLPQIITQKISVDYLSRTTYFSKKIKKNSGGDLKSLPLSQKNEPIGYKKTTNLLFLRLAPRSLPPVP
jgi:hypothetical protein